MRLVVKVLFLFITSAFLLTSCGKGSDPGKYTVPDYRKWKKPVPGVLDNPVPGHGATFRIIYANEKAFSMKMATGEGGVREMRMSDGSVIVKEVYDKRADIGKKTPTLTIMVKDSKSPDALDGWIYYVKKPEKETVVVKGRMCIGCHVAANEAHPYFDGNREELFRDYLFVPFK